MEKTRYVLVAAIGDAGVGSHVDLTQAQAESPLYATRIALVGGGEETPLDVEAIRAQILAELEANVPEFLADAKAEATKLVDAATADAKRIVEAAQAEAMKLAAGKK